MSGEYWLRIVRRPSGMTGPAERPPADDRERWERRQALDQGRVRGYPYLEEEEEGDDGDDQQ